MPVCSVCGGLGFVYKDVPAEHPDYGRAFPCQCRLQELEANRQALLERYSNLGPLTRLTFDNLLPRGKSPDTIGVANQERFYAAYQAALAFAEEPKGWLVLTGVSGSGKTHLAAAIANRCISRGLPALFMVVPDLLDHLRAAFNPGSDISYDELFERVKSCPLLILDDLGTQSSTPWAQEKLYQLINHRYNARLATVITTNLSLDELDERLRTRLTDPDLSHVYVVQAQTRLMLDHFSKLHESMTFENFDMKRLNLPLEQRQNLGEAYRVARRFAESPDGWLVLHGGHGCGKTHLAAAIVNYQRQRGNAVPFLDTGELLDHLRSSFGPESRVSYDELFESVKQSPLLVLDDFGQQAASSWARDKLYQLINYRYNARLPTVNTTSLSLDEIEDRISSRLVDPRLSLMWYIEAPDYRADRRKTEPPSKSEPRRRQTRQ